MARLYIALIYLYVCATAYTFVRYMQKRASADPKIKNDHNKKLLAMVQIAAEACAAIFSILGVLYTLAVIFYFDEFNFSVPIVMRFIYLLLAGFASKVANRIHDKDALYVDWDKVSYINMAISAGLNAANMVLIILFFVAIFI